MAVFAADDGDVGCDVVETFWLRQMMQTLLGTSENSANQAHQPSTIPKQQAKSLSDFIFYHHATTLHRLISFDTKNAYAYQSRVMYSDACPG
jgi:hypothetical protein